MTRAPTILFWFGLIIAASAGLYRTSDQVQQLDHQLHDTEAAIDAEKQSMHVLNAEWVYLTSPQRIEEITHRHLALRQTVPQQVATLATLPDVLPTRAEAMASVAVNATPMANIRSTIAVSMAALHGGRNRHVASTNSGHLRDHMVMPERTASAEPLPGDQIGALIERLGSGH